MEKFSADAGQDAAATHESPDLDARINAALESGTTKTASAGGPMTLQEIYLQMTDLDKTASAAAGMPGDAGEPTEEELAAAAEKLAADEAEALLAGGGGGEQPTEDILKIAAEYDSAGRIMARGFFDEFSKLAASVHTEAAPNRHADSESAAKTPALGARGLPTMETNYAGSPNHDQPISTKGGKEVYKDSLAPSKRVRPGVTGDDPEAAALSIGGGAPVGFATIRDLAG
jgi:hypothetical protein